MVETGRRMSVTMNESSKKFTDYSVYYADEVDKKLNTTMASIKEKPWAKKVLSWFTKKTPDSHERAPSADNLNEEKKQEED